MTRLRVKTQGRPGPRGDRPGSWGTEHSFEDKYSTKVLAEHFQFLFGLGTLLFCSALSPGRRTGCSADH
jgi:hypothetical protein